MVSIENLKLCQCGKPVTGKGNAAKYCDDCREEKRIRDKREIKREFEASALDPDYQGIRFDCMFKEKGINKCNALKRMYCKFENCNFYRKEN